MGWKYSGIDSKIEVIVDPTFLGELEAMAALRPVWIVDTCENHPQIEAIWQAGIHETLCEVNRVPVKTPDDRWSNLSMILEVLDDHYTSYDLIVHGLEATPTTREQLAEQGFDIVQATPDGFIAVRVPGVRELLIGRPRQSDTGTW